MSKLIFTEFAVTRALNTARISNVEGTVCDNEERKMVNFKRKEMRKMEYSVCHERGTKKKSESPTGIEPMTSRTPGGQGFLAFKLSYFFYMRRPV